MDVYPVAQLAEQEQPVFVTRWDPVHANSLIALSDLAEATAKVLLERERHYLAEYGLCSTLPISEAQVAKLVSERIGKEVRVDYPGLETSTANLCNFLFGGPTSEGDTRPDLVEDTVERLIMFYNRRGLRGSPNVLRWLLGREPTTVQEWIEQKLKAVSG